MDDEADYPDAAIHVTVAQRFVAVRVAGVWQVYDNVNSMYLRDFRGNIRKFKKEYVVSRLVGLLNHKENS